MNPLHLYRKDDGVRFTLQKKDGRYVMDTSLMGKPYRYDREVLLPEVFVETKAECTPEISKKHKLRNMQKRQFQIFNTLQRNSKFVFQLPQQIEIQVEDVTTSIDRAYLFSDSQQIFIPSIRKSKPASAISILDPNVREVLDAIEKDWDENNYFTLPLKEVTDGDKHALGYTSWQQYYKGSAFEIISYPELYPSVYFEPEKGKPTIVPIGKRRYIVTYVSPVTEEYYSGKEEPSVTFHETLDPISPYKVCKLEAGKDHLKPYPSERKDYYWFGQPQFIQGEVYPQYNGKAAALLFRLESGWGDSGNEHVFIALDIEGRPVKAWSEFSCC